MVSCSGLIRAQFHRAAKQIFVLSISMKLGPGQFNAIGGFHCKRTILLSETNGEVFTLFLSKLVNL